MNESRMQAQSSQESAGDADARRNVVAHREFVVRRLLRAGLSERLLRRLLPEWIPLIERVATVDVTA